MCRKRPSASVLATPSPSNERALSGSGMAADLDQRSAAIGRPRGSIELRDRHRRQRSAAGEAHLGALRFGSARADHVHHSLRVPLGLGGELELRLSPDAAEQFHWPELPCQGRTRPSPSRSCRAPPARAARARRRARCPLFRGAPRSSSRPVTVTEPVGGMRSASGAAPAELPRPPRASGSLRAAGRRRASARAPCSSRRSAARSSARSSASPSRIGGRTHEVPSAGLPGARPTGIRPRPAASSSTRTRIGGSGASSSSTRSGARRAGACAALKRSPDNAPSAWMRSGAPSARPLTSEVPLPCTAANERAAPRLRRALSLQRRTASRSAPAPAEPSRTRACR